MNVVPVAPLIFDPTHESPDLIDERSPNDPTRSQTGGNVPSVVTPGAPQPVLGADPVVPILAGWNIWDVYQTSAPIDPLPGTLDQQLAAWVRAAAQLAPGAPIALVSNAAAGQVLATRSSFEELNHPLALGADGSAINKRTIAFESSDRLSLPWPHDMNMVLDAVYVPARAATDPVQTPNTNPPALPVKAAGDDDSLMLLLGLGLMGILLASGRRRRR